MITLSVACYLFANAIQQQGLPPEYKEKAAPLWSFGDSSTLIFGASSELGTIKNVGSSSTISILKLSKNPWDVQLKTPPFKDKLKAGDTIYFTYLAQAVGVEEAFYSVHMQQFTPNYGYSQGWYHRVSEEPKKFHFFGVLKEDHDPNTMELTIHLNTKIQSVRITDLRGYNLGPNIDTKKLPTNTVTYVGQSLSAPWRKKAEAMIEKNRKGNFNITVKDKKGKPISGAQVSFKMKAHDYPFGTFTGYFIEESESERAKHAQVLLSRYNRVTVPIYWADWGWEDKVHRKGYMDTMEWATKNKVRMRAHTLLYPGFEFLPERLKLLKDNPEKFREQIIKNTEERIEIMKKFDFEAIDVVNELVTCTDVEEIAGLQTIKDMFTMSRKAWPKASLVYNDFNIFEGSTFGTNISKQREAVYDRLVKAETPIDAWGWQGHFGESFTPLPEVWAALDYFYSKYGKPIEATEFDIDSTDKRAQADYTRDLLTAWFAHPATNGFTMWGYYGPNMWKPNGALYDKSWNEQPNAKEWNRLIYQTWWTNTSVKSDKSGSAKTRGFYGTYVVSITHKGRTYQYDQDFKPNGKKSAVFQLR
jgi:endo-1,4-beta-xylanase